MNSAQRVAKASGISTGPKTAAGKERSKRNALKHGLRSQDVVLPTEDPQEFQSYLDSLMTDWDPASTVQRDLVEQSAVAMWRIKRCRRLETIRLSDRIEEAQEQWDAREDALVDRRLKKLPERPADVVEDLMETRTGVERLIDLWDIITDAAVKPETWSANDHHSLLLYLHGYKVGDPDAALLQDLSWRLVLRHHLDQVGPDDPKPFNELEAELACEMIREIAAAKVDALEAHGDALPDESPARNRFAERAALEERPEDKALARYEAQFTRAYKSSVEQLIKLKQTGADIADEVATGDPAPVADAVSAPEVVAPNELPGELPAESSQDDGCRAAEDVAPNELVPVAPDVVVDPITAGPDGSVWSSDLMPEGP